MTEEKAPAINASKEAPGRTPLGLSHPGMDAETNSAPHRRPSSRNTATTPPPPSSP